MKLMSFAALLLILSATSAGGQTTVLNPLTGRQMQTPPMVPACILEDTIDSDVRGVSHVLDSLHAAAARADGATYFGLFDPDASFIGTDVSERWTLVEFRAYAEPLFARGTGWTYTLRPGSRHIRFDRQRQVAWFDEVLDSASYGTSRGTGVLVDEEGCWRIAQYHLTFPIPNALAPEFTRRIREHEGRAAAAR